MKYQNYKIIKINRKDDSFYPCNTSGLMDAEIKMIYEANKAYLTKKGVKYMVVQRRYDSSVRIHTALSYGTEPVYKKPIMKKCCATCPFKKINGKMQNIELATDVIQRNLFNGQQTCHHPRISGQKETHRCRGYFDYAEVIYQRIGLDTEKLFLNSKNTTNANRENVH